MNSIKQSQASLCVNDEKRSKKLKIISNLKLNLDYKDKKIQLKDFKTPQTLTSIKKFQKKCHDYINKKQFIIGIFENKYELKEKIGQGAHAIVYRCIQKSTRKQFAVKITKQGDQQLLESSKKQFQILKEITHKNIMKADSFYIDRNKMTTYLVCQLCNFPELAIYLRNQNLNLVSESQATSIIAKILQALQYLHGKGICHRDIKPENILYDPETKNIKLIDFDCANKIKKAEQKHQMWTKMGNIHYQAPQYFSQIFYTEKVDIWSLGMIAYLLVFGKLPFKSNYYNQMVKLITTDEINFQCLNISFEFKSLLKKMLQKDSNIRYSAKDCRRLPILLKEKPDNITEIMDDFAINQENSKPNIFDCLSCKFLKQKRKYEYLNSKQHEIIVKYFCLDKI